MAPAPSSANIPLKWIAIGFVALVAVLWIALTNTFQPPKPAVVTVTPAKTEAAPAPQTASAAPPAALLACPGEAYKTRAGLIICGVTMVDNQYVWVQSGWIAPAGNMSAAFTLVGDTSSCQFQLVANRLVVNCKNPIAVGK